MTVPRHIGFIMDGNRRWAREHDVTPLQGHYAGYQKVLEVAQWCADAGIEVVSLYAFSKENWGRSQREVGYLLRLFEQALTRHRAEFVEKGIRVLVSGSADGLSPAVVRLLKKIQDDTARNTALTVNFCFNYSGRDELVHAVRRMIRDGVRPAAVSEKSIAKNLFQQLPDPDLIVRTSGEQRLSNFLLWQCAYAELLFVKKYWPALTKSDFKNMLSEYAARKRRFGV